MAAEAGVQWAAEAALVEHAERVEAGAGLVVQLPTVGHVAAPQRSPQSRRTLGLLTDEAGVDVWRRGRLTVRWTQDTPGSKGHLLPRLTWCQGSPGSQGSPGAKAHLVPRLTW